MNSRLTFCITRSLCPAAVAAAISLVFALAGLGLFAADSSDKALQKEESVDGVSFETKAQYSVTTGSRMHSGSKDVHDVSSQSGSAEAVMSMHLDENVLFRAGVGWERHSFGFSGHGPLPEVLQSANLIVGADVDISDQWMMRVEIQPGVYSDWLNVGTDDLNCPLIFGFTWLPDKDIQWVFGLSVDVRRDFPVLPGIGVRWKFADRWTLMAIPPNPRVEFDLNEQLTLFCGADLLYGTYHVNDVHGMVRHHNLDNSFVDYSEIRGGVGLKWKVARSIALELQGGSMVHREFDFHTDDVKFRSRPSLYGEFGLVAKF